MKYKIFLLIPIYLYSFSGFSQLSLRPVILKGTLENFPEQVKIEDISEFADLFPLKYSTVINRDSAGHFSIVFIINKPNYFKIGRNVMFLSPGDSMTVFLDYKKPQRAFFSGIGSQVNAYLRETPFPKEGSFIQGGDQIENDFATTMKKIFSLAKNRENDLGKMQAVSKEFVNLEKGRLKADIINSLFDMRYYYPDVVTEDSVKIFSEAYKKIAIPKIRELAVNFYDSSLLKIEVYREIIHIIKENSGSNFGYSAQGKCVQGWFLARQIAHKIASTYFKDSLQFLEQEINRLKLSNYKSSITEFLHFKILNSKGSAAADFIAINEKKEKIALSSFRGKVIYIDLWATWCGPCILEQLYFEKLKDKYKNNKAIVFIALSIDNDLERWSDAIKLKGAKGNQWNINRLSLLGYSVITIPRSILIDKDFKVFDMNAPSPSSGKIEDMLKCLLK